MECPTWAVPSCLLLVAFPFCFVLFWDYLIRFVSGVVVVTSCFLVPSTLVLSWLRVVLRYASFVSAVSLRTLAAVLEQSCSFADSRLLLAALLG